MTSGTTITGTYGSGYYRKRVWSGADGPRSEEHNYNYTVNESFLPKAKYRRVGSGSWLSGGMSSFLPGYPILVPNSPIPELTNRTTSKVWQDLRQTAFHAGVFSGEFKMSYIMLTTIVRRIALAITAMKRGRWQRAAWLLSMNDRKVSLSGAAANSYMAVHFGIIPLCYDMKAIYELMRDPKWLVVKRVSRYSGYKYETAITHNTSQVQWQYWRKAIVEIRGRVKMQDLSVVDRLNLNDLAGVAWELTRLSWLVDWILPIGNFLEAINASNRTQGESFYVTEKWHDGFRDPKNGKIYQVDPFDVSAFTMRAAVATENGRSLMTSLPWRFPTIQNPLGDNLSRWVTSAALLRQSVGR